MTDIAVVCANADCRVAQDEKCVEGYELDKCPFFGKVAEAEALDKKLESDESKTGSPCTALDLGVALNSIQASSVLRQGESRVIGVVGAHDSGKTSLLAGLYDLFQLGPIGEVTFAGSTTLHSFEAACHDARAASLRGVAHSPRTKRGDARFYHLDLKNLTQATFLSLLIGDRSGEEYEAVADDISHASPLFELRRSETVTILVDGRRLCEDKARHETIAAIPLIVQGLMEGGVFERRPQLALVLTKDDVVQASGKANRAKRDFDKILEGLRRKHSNTFSVIEDFVTAASPTDPAAARGAGLPELLSFWLQPSAVAAVPLRSFRSNRTFDRLLPKDE